MKVYEDLTAPVLSYYQLRVGVTEIVATGTPDSVYEKIFQAI
jgi:adenylate kinase family enzyme